MVYIKIWTDFEKAATDLYSGAPNKVRYCVSFRPKTGQLVLKLTDDTTCIMYKSFSSIILNRFDALNVRLLSQIANARPRIRTSATPGPSTEVGRGATPGVGGEDDPMLSTGVAGGEKGRERSGTPAVKGVAEGSSGGGAAGGGKKKKKGKR